MKPYPFPLVYEYFAQTIIAEGLPKDEDLEPMLFAVRVVDDEIVNIAPLPVAAFFRDARGKAELGRFLQRIVPDLPAEACLVLISEAYERGIDAKPGMSAAEARQHANVPDSLADDPLAQEVLFIQIYRPGTYRMGRLPIRLGRILEYSPLSPEYDRAEGRLVPDTTPAGERRTH